MSRIFGKYSHKFIFKKVVEIFLEKKIKEWPQVEKISASGSISLFYINRNSIFDNDYTHHLSEHHRVLDPYLSSPESRRKLLNTKPFPSLQI